MRIEFDSHIAGRFPFAPNRANAAILDARLWGGIYVEPAVLHLHLTAALDPPVSHPSGEVLEEQYPARVSLRRAVALSGR